MLQCSCIIMAAGQAVYKMIIRVACSSAFEEKRRQPLAKAQQQCGNLITSCRLPAPALLARHVGGARVAGRVAGLAEVLLSLRDCGDGAGATGTTGGQLGDGSVGGFCLSAFNSIRGNVEYSETEFMLKCKQSGLP